jgi:hypothetical protein
VEEEEGVEGVEEEDAAFGEEEVEEEEGVGPQGMEVCFSQSGLSWGVLEMTRESAWEMHKEKSQVFPFARLWS